jgi:hypothetical protein
MGGGLLQLVAYGAQDAYLSGNPQITFWRGLFKRHTNFAMEPFRVTTTGQAAWGTKHSAILGRHADLVSSCYLEVILDDIDAKTYPIRYGPNDRTFLTNPQRIVNDGLILPGFQYSIASIRTGAGPISNFTTIGAPNNNIGTVFVATAAATTPAGGTGQLIQVGQTNNLSPVKAAYNMLRYVELDIGGQVIDRLYGEWMFIWTMLTHNFDKWNQLSAMMYDTGQGQGTVGIAGRPILGNNYLIPLPFYFGRNPGAALPLIALQYHEVKINIMWNKTEIVQSSATVQSGANLINGPRQCNVICDYIYLDVEERRRMAQESHEYLIEQTQFNEQKGVTGAQVRVDLTFNHPVKELVWVVQNSAFGNCKVSNSANAALLGVFDPLNYRENAMYNANLQLNGQDRMQTLYAPYFNAVQPYQHHSGGYAFNTGDNAGVYMYSFALKPEEHQPSGTCNFSRIDTATLVMSLNGSTSVSLQDPQNYDVRVYAVNYNILRVMSGMGGLAYSN